nr:hypothetical protein CFP56_11376 [Quercus suber]
MDAGLGTGLRNVLMWTNIFTLCSPRARGHAALGDTGGFDARHRISRIVVPVTRQHVRHHFVYSSRISDLAARKTSVSHLVRSWGFSSTSGALVANPLPGPPHCAGMTVLPVTATF